MAARTPIRWNRLLVPMLLGVGIVANLGREIIFGQVFGGSREIEIFRVAFGLPNTLLQCLGAPFVGVALPLVVAAHGLGPEAERAVARRILKVGGLAFASLAFLGYLTSDPLIRLMAPGFDPEAAAQASAQLQILWGFLIVASLSTPLRARLNARDVLWPGASVSALISLSLCTVALLPQSPADGVTRSLPLVFGALAGAWLVLLVHLFAQLRAGPWPATEAPPDTALADLLRRPLLGPLLGAAAYQVANVIPRFLDRGYASTLSEGGVAAVEYSYNFLTAPGILLGTSFVMVAYPGFARAIAAGHEAAQARRLRVPLLLIASSAAAIGLVFLAFAQPLTELIYARGAFGETEVRQTSAVLRGQALALPFLVLAMVFSQALLGLGMIRALLLVGLVRVGVRWSWLAAATPAHGLDGIGWAHTMTELATALLLAGVLLIRIGKPPSRLPPATLDARHPA